MAVDSDVRDRPACSVQADALLRAAAATGLRSSSTPVHVDDAATATWLAAVGRERLSGHLMRAIAAGDVSMSSAAQQAVSQFHMSCMLRALQLEQTLVRVCDLLDDADIELRVLKGPAVSRTVYDDAVTRSFVDVDVLVPSRDFDRAVAALAAAGYTRTLPELRPGFDRRFAKSVTFVDDRGCQVDLHRTLVVGPFGLMVDTDDLFRTHEIVEIAGRPLRTLAPEEQFLSVCYHAALGDVPPRLSVLRDVAEMLLRVQMDTARVLALARRWGGEIVVARAVRLAWTALRPQDVPSLVDWAFGFRPRWRDRALLASYVSTHRSNSWKYLASASVIPGFGAKLSYLRALLTPQHRFLMHRAPGWAHWWLHGVGSLLRRAEDPREAAS